jgi:hypothetical protein
MIVSQMFAAITYDRLACRRADRIRGAVAAARMSPYGSCETSRRDPGKCAYGVKAVMRRVMATLADGESWSNSALALALGASAHAASTRTSQHGHECRRRTGLDRAKRFEAMAAV